MKRYRAADKANRRRSSMYITEKTLEALQKVCIEWGVSQAAIVESLIQEFIDNESVRNKTWNKLLIKMREDGRDM